MPRDIGVKSSVVGAGQPVYSRTMNGNEANLHLPPSEEMYRALVERDTRSDGLFVAAIRTTGIFCRPSCGARKPKPENVEYFATPREAMLRGYRPCKRCSPLDVPGRTPPEIAHLIADLHAKPDVRLRDADLRHRGLQPERIRRWFKKHHGMTFHAYQRLLRLGIAFDRIRQGEDIASAAFASGHGSLSGFGEAFKRTAGHSPNQSRQRELVTISRIETALGPMFVGSVDRGVCLLEFVDRRMLETQLDRVRRILNAELYPGEHRLNRAMETELAEYFAGTRRAFDVPLVTAGTPFQESVWAELRSIPYGETRSYAEQAKRIGRPTAVRAVARANGDNRIAIVIPCHRVIGSDGKLTGYGGGLWRKQRLLDLEQSLQS